MDREDTVVVTPIFARPRKVAGASVALAVSSALLAAACAPTPPPPKQGAWSVLVYPTPVRAIHATVLRTGNVLLVAGSGNDRVTTQCR